MNKIQTYLMKIGNIAWREDRLELKNSPILIGQGISQGLCLPHILQTLLFIHQAFMSDNSDATFKLDRDF